MIPSKQKSPSEIETLLNTPHKSFAGLTFLPSEDRWKLRHKHQNVNLAGGCKLIIPEESWGYFKLALALYARVCKAGSVCAIANTLNMFAAKFGADLNILEEADFLSLKPKLGREREGALGKVRGFFKFWFETGMGGISKDYLDALYQVKLKGDVKGEAVKSHDPFIGPYTPIELQAVIDGINNAFLEDRLSTGNYVLTFLFAQRGSRTNQIKNLRVSDFKLNNRQASVDMPRGKQRGSGFREEFSTFSISEDLYQLVRILRKESLDTVEECLPKAQRYLIHQVTDDLLPVFGAWKGFARDLPSILEARKTSEEHHLGEQALAQRLRYVSRVINVHSERTGEIINLTSHRFRRTIGTDLAREGAGVGVIARALDHTDYQNAGVYVSTSADMATRLDQKIGKLLGPLAQAFAGVLVRDEADAVRGDDPKSRIRTNTGSDNVGTCGNFAFCGSRAPIACYTCIKFQPWIDAPHEEILIDLYDERREILDATGDETIASQLDRTILAVEDVIHRCELKRVEIMEVE
ncbi:site-specific integrase [Marinobacter sp. LN3S78]|uniref:site-specific integrase n=1 Tax=Marinobacter sp. LN3S78 TaxID=3382300 RepID=UPI00387AF121